MKYILINTCSPAPSSTVRAELGLPPPPLPPTHFENKELPFSRAHKPFSICNGTVNMKCSAFLVFRQSGVCFLPRMWTLRDPAGSNPPLSSPVTRATSLLTPSPLLSSPSLPPSLRPFVRPSLPQNLRPLPSPMYHVPCPDDPPSDPLPVQHKLAGNALFLKGDYESALERYLEAIEEGERLCRRENGEEIYLHPTTLLCLQFLTTLSLLPLP